MSATGGQAPKAILFDWDNTLVDTWDVIHDAMNVTLTAYGMEPWTLAQTRKRVRRSMRDAFPDLFGEHWQEAGDCFYARYQEIHLEKLNPSPGARQMLDDLTSAGLYLGVVSNKLGSYLREEVAHMGWSGYFGQLVGALDAAHDKPAPDTVDLALDGSGIRPGPAVWFAGDTAVDLECAVNAGCTPVLIRPQSPQPEEFSGHAPQWYCADCAALSKLILAM
jgi:phosphoglycolate phosphatase